MEPEEKQRKVLYSEWTITKPIKLDDICVLESTEQEFLCSKIIPYKQFEYLYFGSLDYKDTLFAVQYVSNNNNYVKTLSEKSQQEFAYTLYKKANEIS